MSKYLTTEQAAKHLQVPASRLNKARMGCDGPPYIKMGHLIRYLVEDLDQWMMEQRRF